ncbi:nitroreductase family deazaflavin-dependent oxidoreductase [Hamadaea tsunoensis]|uniref:nitroreductase family deazaflavin-dependent oxidoreductase n=1 Tax=Hamadaea tsunoensis TaxID=53368 RepID=UPI001FE19CCB|nr:nitroreductase family deazaflavin-dependent oxidoreductase [Hamadaea tsunoensis]
MAEMPTDMRAYNRQVISDFRAHGAPPGRPLLLLTTTGRRSGAARTTPMMFVRLDGRLHVIASNAGAPRDPDWYLNLVADPRVVVEVGSSTIAATASSLTGADREAAWGRITADYPFFVDHQAGVSRVIPVVALDPV